MNIVEFDFLDGYVVGRSVEAGSEGWYYAPTPEGLASPSWQSITTFDGSHLMHIAGQAAFLVDTVRGKAWVNALLINSSEVLNTKNFAFYIDPYDKTIKVRSWDNNYPNGTPTDNSMPRANLCVMWKDFLVLGDIVWKSNEPKSFSRKNSTRIKHFMWFSQPGKTESWDPIDFVAMGQKSGSNKIVGIFPLENGLFVLTTEIAILLDGTPDDFVYRELRSGISPQTVENATFWPARGGVAWADASNRIWLTNGQNFVRVDEAIKLDDVKSVTSVDEYLIVSTVSDVHVLRSFGEALAWTRLNVPFTWQAERSSATKIYGIDQRRSGGTFRLDDEELGQLDQNALWNIQSFVSVLDMYDDARGTYNGNAVSSTVISRPLPPTGHDRTFWHRVGVRAKGPGSIIKIVSYADKTTDSEYHQTYLHADLSNRYDYIVPAHGPSLSAMFEAEFEGDVTVEHMTVWAHKGSLER